MPDRSDDYQLPSWPKTKIDRDLWNAVMRDLAARLKARELLEASFELLQEQGIQAALDYIQVSIAPQLAGLKQDIANAQAKIDEILTGNAPNAQKLGGQLPSYYASAQTLLDGLAGKVDTTTYAAAIALLAPKANAALTGNPTATTQAAGNNSTRIATTAFLQAAINAFASTVVLKAGDSMYGPLVLPAGVAGAAPLNMPHGVAPTTPVNGDLWTTTAGLAYRVNGVTRTSHDTSNLIAATQTEAEVGTGTTNRIWTPQRVFQAIAAYLTANVPPSIGVGQTWQTPSRAISTTYQNTTGKPIMVMAYWSEGNSIDRPFQISTDNVNWTRLWGANAWCFLIIPNGCYYRVVGPTNFGAWMELR